jgi:vacuolar-type H+-ATPase subunit I/STV1
LNIEKIINLAGLHFTLWARKTKFEPKFLYSKMVVLAFFFGLNQLLFGFFDKN